MKNYFYGDNPGIDLENYVLDAESPAIEPAGIASNGRFRLTGHFDRLSDLNSFYYLTEPRYLFRSCKVQGTYL